MDWDADDWEDAADAAADIAELPGGVAVVLLVALVLIALWLTYG